MSKRKTWISVLIAAVIIVGILAVTAVGGTFYFISRHVHTQFTGTATADQRFAEARARYAGQQPLIEIRKDDEPVLHRETIPKTMPAAKLDTAQHLSSPYTGTWPNAASADPSSPPLAKPTAGEPPSWSWP
jgi:type II secretory pathway pseudopilin PulG